MGSRHKGAQKAWGDSPSQPRTPPTHARSNRKGWLALSGFLCLPRAQESVENPALEKRKSPALTRAPRTQGSQTPKKRGLPE